MSQSKHTNRIPALDAGTSPNVTWSKGRPLRGIIVPLVTPLLGRDEIDVPGLERVVDHTLYGGVHGYFLLGTTGEATALCGRLRREAVTRVCRRVAGRVPILVNVSDTSVVESLRLADDAMRAGADAIVVTTPYYLPLEAKELTGYVRAISRDSALPVFLYNMPELTKMWFTTDVLSQLLDLENVVGLKDSSGDSDYFQATLKLMSHRPDWSLLLGSESMMADAVRQGAHGSVAGGANVWPQLLVSLYEAALVDDDRVPALQQQLLEMSEIYRYGKFASGTIRGIKCALSLMSICSERMADPYLPATDPQREAIASVLRSLGLLADASANGSHTSRRDGAAQANRLYGSASQAPTPTR
jgi:4-hydroxy-tetrahydrodipicolinate synthase